jgi:hypothetical protein
VNEHTFGHQILLLLTKFFRQFIRESILNSTKVEEAWNKLKSFMNGEVEHIPTVASLDSTVLKDVLKAQWKHHFASKRSEFSTETPFGHRDKRLVDLNFSLEVLWSKRFKNLTTCFTDLWKTVVIVGASDFMVEVKEAKDEASVFLLNVSTSQFIRKPLFDEKNCSE